MGDKIILCGVLVGKFEGKGEVGKHTRRWHDDMKMDVDEMVREVSKGFFYFKTGVSGDLLEIP